MINARTFTHWLAGTLLMMSLFLGYRPVLAQLPVKTTASQQPVVHAVMFWLESCGHCQYVMEEILPPLQAQYGGQLDITLVQVVSTADFDRLYQIAAAFKVPKEEVGAPFLVVGDHALSGSNQISKELPGLIEQYLAQGGVGISDKLASLLSTPETHPQVIYLFWGDGCPHCERARPALQNLAQRYPNVEVREYEVWYQPENQSIFTGIAAKFGFEPRYVPTIFIGERYWEGYAEDIQAEIESTLAACLETGCTDAGAGVISVALPTTEVVLLPDTVETVVPVVANPMQSNGFTLAWVVLVAMTATSLYAIVYLGVGLRSEKKLPGIETNPDWRSLGLLALCLIGLGVAGYLAYVETQSVRAICGPVGDCNTVQSSSYAKLFGVLPIGILGMIGYLAILAAWFYPRLRRDRWASYAPIIVLGMTFFGVLFSIYLTYLEIYVIRAVCMWCLASAVIMTLLMLLSLRPAKCYLIGDSHAEEESS